MTFADIRWDLFLGGLGLFLFGIVLMGDGLKAVAGDKLRGYIDKYASKSCFVNNSLEPTTLVKNFITFCPSLSSLSM